MQFYNVHSHVFTMKNAPRHFLHLYLPAALADAIDKLTNTQAGANTIGWILSKFGSGAKRYASFLQIGKSKSQLEVFEDLVQQYDDPNIKFVALTMYMEKCGADSSESGYEGQLEEILTVKKQYPDNLLIFLGIDPRWKNSGPQLRDEVVRYFENKLVINAGRSVYPFAGLKLYPSTGFYVFHENLKETFEWAAENGVPVLSHCNYLGGIYNNDTTFVQGNLNPLNVYTGKPYADEFPGTNGPQYFQSKGFWKWLMGTRKNDSNKNSCSYFLEPASYKSLLKAFAQPPRKPLKLCLAHFGGDDQIMAEHGGKPTGTLYGMVQKNWCAQIKELLTEYPNVYTDISYALSDPDTHQPVFTELNTPAYGERILFGTDFFLTERKLPEKTDYSVFKKNALATTLSSFGNRNAWDQVAGLNTNEFLQSKYYNGTVI